MKKTLAIISIFLLFLNINPVQIAITDNKPNNSLGFLEESTFDICYGNTFYVGGLGPGNHTNIQSAIDVASSGDNIFVYSGTYFENVNIGKSIKLQGQDMNSTIIDGEGNHHTININSDSVTLSGFTINNSEIGIVLDSSSDTKINANTIRNMDVGIWLFDSSHNKITNNNLNNNLVGIELLSSSNHNEIIDNNIQYNAFGIMLYTSSYNTIKKNTIKQNHESGIWLNYSSNNNEISNNTIENNEIGIDIFLSQYNIIYQNNITNQNIGICLDDYSNENNIYQNNFLENTNNAYGEGSNLWDDGEYGNFWSDYNEKYPNASQKLLTPFIWNTPYEINEMNADNFPLVTQWPKPISYPHSNCYIFKYPLIYYLFEIYPNGFPTIRKLLEF